MYIQHTIYVVYDIPPYPMYHITIVIFQLGFLEKNKNSTTWSDKPEGHLIGPFISTPSVPTPPALLAKSPQNIGVCFKGREWLE